MRPSSRPTADKKPASAFGNRKNFSRSKKSCPFTGENAPAIDHKNVRLLQRFITDHGKIMPKRITGVSAKNQRALASAIKRARFLALLPSVNR
jgi:small subunit ribosomal protein S18